MLMPDHEPDPWEDAEEFPWDPDGEPPERDEDYFYEEYEWDD